MPKPSEEKEERLKREILEALEELKKALVKSKENGIRANHS